MVTVISGGSHSGRDKVFIDKIKSAVKNGEQVMVIIPDQFSFEYDKKLYEHLGAADFNVIQTAGFNRIAEFTEKLYGGRVKENADDNVRTILMYKAVGPRDEAALAHDRTVLPLAAVAVGRGLL